MRSPRAVALAALVASPAVLCTTQAQASWSSQGSGAGVAGASALATPAPRNDCAAAKGSTVTVTVSWPTVAGASTYKVELAQGTGTYSVVTRSSPSATSETFTESAGTYSYRVTALLSNWLSQGGVTTRVVNNGGTCGAST